MGIMMVPFLLLTKMAIGQNFEMPAPYEEMPKDVQQKMDENKMSGLNVYNDIIVKFNVTVSGLEITEYDELRLRAAKINQLMSIDISDNVVTLILSGETPFSQAKRIFSDLVTGISDIKGTYSIKK